MQMPRGFFVPGLKQPLSDPVIMLHDYDSHNKDDKSLVKTKHQRLSNLQEKP